MAVPVAIFWRNLGGALFSLPFALRSGEWRRMSNNAWLWSVIAGVFLALHFICFFASMRLTSVASGVAITAVQPIFAAIWVRMRGAKVAMQVWFGMAVSMVGVLIITGIDWQLSTRALIGDLIALLGAALSAAYVIAGGHVLREISPTTYTTVCYFVCAATCFVVVLFTDAPIIDYPRYEWLLVLGLILGAQILGHTMFNQVLQRVSPTVVSLIVFFELPVGALLAVWWLDQIPPAGVIPGLVLLLIGSGLVATKSASLQVDQVDKND
jgi:drug/metabolite transporter (DMT)-like permease